MKAIGLGVDRDALDPSNVFDQLGQLRGVCNHRSPLKSNSAFVLVTCKLSINFSIASIGGRAAMVFRNSCTRSHSSG